MTELRGASDTPAPSYRQILRSTAWIGGSSVISILVGIVRTKAMAVILGPSGFGLFGLYGAILDLATAIASLGIGGSGVRQIAESVSTGDNAKIARTVFVLRRTALLLALTGAALLAGLAAPISYVTFGNDLHAAAIALLGLAVFFRLISTGQSALLQGMRRVADLAKVTVFGAVLGTGIAVVFVYYLGQRGIAPSLVAIAALASAASWWYSRQTRIEFPALTREEFRVEVASLLRLGFAFMVSGTLMMGAAYIVRILVLREAGLEAAGFYAAAWTIGGMYVGVVLQAMGSDFYPRLVGVGADDSRCNQLVNEQTLISLLIGGPGVLATLTLAPAVISVFYSQAFLEAVDVLRWICLGIAIRLVAWPVGFIIVARNRQAAFVATEVAWTVVNVGATWIFVEYFGMVGAGIAFLCSYAFHLAVVFRLARSISEFAWTREVRNLAVLFSAATGIVFIALIVLPTVIGYGLGAVITAAAGVHSLRTLLVLVPSSRLVRLLRR